jgi:hypothetical protein
MNHVNLNFLFLLIININYLKYFKILFLIFWIIN